VSSRDIKVNVKYYSLIKFRLKWGKELTWFYNSLSPNRTELSSFCLFSIWCEKRFDSYCTQAFRWFHYAIWSAHIKAIAFFL